MSSSIDVDVFLASDISATGSWCSASAEVKRCRGSTASRWCLIGDARAARPGRRSVARTTLLGGVVTSTWTRVSPCCARLPAWPGCHMRGGQ